MNSSNYNVQPPNVFISHASEDKERFVIKFATRLRENGVDAWLDKWEMLPGDILIKKIFDEGIKNSDVVIIVLSQISVKKPWVREEINASFMQRISGKVRIIPVVIDECEIPLVLQATLYEKISNSDNYNESLRRILFSIFDISEKPSLGNPPRFVQLHIDKIPGLTRTDTSILKLACELTLEEGVSFVNSSRLEQEAKNLDLSTEEILESIQVLENRWLIKVTWVHGGGLPPFKITTRGFETYGKYYTEDFNSIVTNTLLAIINKELKALGDIASFLNKPLMFAEYILDILDERKLIRVHKTLGDRAMNIVVGEVTVQGKRLALQTR